MLTLEYFDYKWYTFTVHVHSSINVELFLFIKSQFTINNENILHLNHYMRGRVWWLTVTHFQRREAVSNGLNSSEIVNEVFIYFKLKPNTLGF